MKTNVVTKLAWLAVCALVVFSMDSAVRADVPAPKANAQHTAR